jgi:modulator of FtsH protease HflK
MPWSNQSGGGGKDGGGGSGGSGGPWGGGSGGGDKGGGNKGGGPWGQGPSGGGGNQQPDLEELLKRSQEKLRRVMPGGGGGGGLPASLVFLLGTVLAVLGGIWAFTFRVNPDEVGIVMRFGQYVRKAEPGWHVKWPPPFETVYFPAVTRQNTEQMGFRSSDSGRGFGGAVRDTPEESLMLTGDENIVDVNFVVRWSIKPDKVQDFLFNIEKPERTIREVAESVMREVIGQTNIQPILTEARQRTEQSVQKLMQQVLDSYGSGVRIDQVQLQKVDPPEQVIDAFRDVQAARADKEKLQNEAVTYANKVVPEAHGDAERILQAAEGYKTQTVAEASGQAARFTKVYEQYKKAPDVTRQRIYLETMERVMSQSETIILDQKGGQGAIPFLSLDQLQPKR